MSNAQTKVETPLMRTIETTPTDVWNDSCSVEELKYALANGAVGRPPTLRSFSLF